MKETDNAPTQHKQPTELNLRFHYFLFHSTSTSCPATGCSGVPSSSALGASPSSAFLAASSATSPVSSFCSNVCATKLHTAAQNQNTSALMQRLAPVERLQL
eukprot:889159_1